MKILILGQGAREHAIVKALIRTGTDPKDILVAPGNKGIAQEVECESNIDITDRQSENWNEGTEHHETSEACRDPFFCFTGEQIHKDDQTDATSQDDLGRDGVVVNRW